MDCQTYAANYHPTLAQILGSQATCNLITGQWNTGLFIVAGVLVLVALSKWKVL